MLSRLEIKRKFESICTGAAKQPSNLQQIVNDVVNRNVW